MLVRDLRRLCLIIAPLLAFFFITLTIWGFPSSSSSFSASSEKVTSLLGDTFKSGSNKDNNKVPYHGGSSSSSSSKHGSGTQSPSSPGPEAGAGAGSNGGIEPGLFQSDPEEKGKDGIEGTEGGIEATHQVIHSVSTKNGSYFRIEFGPNTPAFNPNVIPHPTRPGVFIIVAQKWHEPRQKPSSSSSASPSSPDSPSSDGNHTDNEKGSNKSKSKSQHVTMQSELSCLATFNPQHNLLSCLPDHPPLPLPIAATPGNNCVGPLLGVLSFNVGPHDARVFYGGDGKPYTIFGSNSQFTCFGMWMQDFRVLVEWWGAEVEAFGAGEGWRVAGELQRPMIEGGIAKGVEAGAKATNGKVGSGGQGDEVGDLKGKAIEGTEEGNDLKEKDEEGKPKIPPGWGEIEKNWFVFWAPPFSSSDSSAPGSSSSSSPSSPNNSPPSSSHHSPHAHTRALQTYIHYDFFPHRSFALLNDDGSATPLPPSSSSSAPLSSSAANDESCLTHYLPSLPPSEPVSIHQSTNSLSITLCNRSDPSCHPSDQTTFLMTIIQHKTFYHFHSEYEPYVVLFSQKPPGFEVFGVSKKPVWIEGRKKWGRAGGEYYDKEKENEGQAEGEGDEGWEGKGGKGRTEMFYVTSVNWRDYRDPGEGRGEAKGEGNQGEGNNEYGNYGKGYHGYLDDVLVIGFGMEDKESGGIDVLAGELIKGVGLCNDVVGKQVENVGHGVSMSDALDGPGGVPDLGLTRPDGFPEKEIPPDIPADFPADFPADAPNAAPMQADFGLGPGVPLDTPPSPPQMQPGLLRRR